LLGKSFISGIIEDSIVSAAQLPSPKSLPRRYVFPDLTGATDQISTIWFFGDHNVHTSEA
jgi:hypothetical protein